jgi:hypothetical protein
MPRPAAAVFALQWYTQMQAGKFDRSQYAAAYGAQLTPEAVQAMSQHLNRYGASPLRAEIMKKRTKARLSSDPWPRGIS